MDEKKSVRELLAEQGIPPDRIADKIYLEIIPPPFRVIQSMRLLFGGSPSFAEWNYVRQVADAASWAEVEMAYFNYWLSASREASILGKTLGCFSSRRRPYRLYFKLKYPDLD